MALAEILRETKFDALRTAEEVVHFIEKGDQAGEEFYAEAGKLLRRLKENKPEDVTWEAYVKEMCGITKRWANALIAIADGKTTIRELREKNRESKARARREGRPSRSDEESCEEVEEVEDEEPVDPRNYLSAFQFSVLLARRDGVSWPS